MAEKKKELYKGATGLRVGAIILWALAIACEVFAIYLLLTTNEEVIYRLAGANYGDTNALLFWFIGILVLDAILCIVGSLLWKKANRIKPSQSKSKFVKFIWDQLGVIMCLFAFIPIGILLLRNNDKFNPKAKKILVAVVAVLLAGSISASIDYNPVEPGDAQNLEALIESHYSEEELTRDENGNIVVWWTQYGKSFHLDENDAYIADSVTKTSSTLKEAIEAGRTDPCDYCVAEIKDLNKEDIEGIYEEDLEGAEESLDAEPVEDVVLRLGKLLHHVVNAVLAGIDSEVAF